MGSTLYKNDPNIIIEYMKSYLKSKPPDCTLFSKDGFEIPVHKELIYQTKLIPQIIKSGTDCCCSNIDIIFPSLEKKQLELMVQFLYDGQIFCPDPITATEVISNLKEFFGVPDLMDIVETSSVKTEDVCQEEEAFEYSANFKPDINPFETIESDITKSFENSCNQKVEASPTNPEKAQKQVTKCGNSEPDCNSPVSEICNKKLSNYKFLNRS